MPTMLKIYERMLCTFVISTALLVLLPAILSAADNSSSEVNFLELYTKTIRAVDAGELDQSIAKKTRSLNTELQKKIIALDTRVETLKTDSMQQEGSKRDVLLDELVATGAEKERIYLVYYQRLEQIVVRDKQVNEKTPPPTLTDHTTDKKTKNVKSNEDSSPNSQTRFLTVESAPEDVTTGEFE